MGLNNFCNWLRLKAPVIASFDDILLVRSMVVQDEVRILTTFVFLVELAQEFEEFLVPVAGITFAGHFAGGHPTPKQSPWDK